jgi:carbonic anhydrase/acetyltransferase-like protein (isoleucine patch superfamily)
MTVRSFDNQEPVIHESVWIDPSALVAGRVTLGEDVSVWPRAVIRGDVNTISVGSKTNIQDGAVLHCTHDGPYTRGGKNLTIGERVTIGHQVCLHGCTIGNDVLVGIGAIVLDGAVVENLVMIGAGSLVPPGKTLKSGYLYLGSPVKMARPLNDVEKEFLKYSAIHYVKLANRHRDVTG